MVQNVEKFKRSCSIRSRTCSELHSVFRAKLFAVEPRFFPVNLSGDPHVSPQYTPHTQHSHTADSKMPEPKHKKNNNT